MADNDWKQRLGVVFSTNPDYNYATEAEAAEEPDTLAPDKQRLRVMKETAGRKGKTVTIVKGFVGKEDDLKALAKSIKTRLCTGGSTKDGEVVLQGDVREKIIGFLKDSGYNAR